MTLPSVETVIEDPRWDGIGLSALAERAASAGLTALLPPGEGFALCVMGCDDARIAALNGTFRGKGAATNVLSWPSETRTPATPGARPPAPDPGPPDDPEELGDIALAWETCAAEAAAQGIPLADHVTHLVLHGLLHLLGYDHTEDADAALMEATETAILRGLGIADPYGERAGPAAQPSAGGAG